MSTNARLIVRKNFTKTDGTHPIYLRLSINSSVKIYSLNVSSTIKDWNKVKCRVKNSHKDEKKVNLTLSNAINRANEIIFKYEINNKPLTFIDFEREYFAPIFSDNSFYSFVNYSIKSKEGLLSRETTRSHKAHLSKLKKYKPQLTFGAISVKFLEGYRIYMLKELGNNENTCSKSLNFVKVMMNRALSEGVIDNNPISHYKLQKIKGNREFLSIAELEKLETLLNKPINKKLKIVLNYFLFACYTGLRYQDIKDLRHGNLVDDMIKITMHKTKQVIKIPLIKKAKNLIVPGFPEQKVFKVFANQVTNRYLKEIVKLEDVQIKKNISFHCARHTFATVGMELGISIEYISNLLGHKDLRTTQIYARILDHRKIEEMKKWDY